MRSYFSQMFNDIIKLRHVDNYHNLPNSFLMKRKLKVVLILFVSLHLISLVALRCVCDVSEIE